MNKNKFYNLIDSRFNEAKFIDSDIVYRSPNDLINKNRIDIPIKIKYIDSIIKNNNISYFRSIYRKTISYFSDDLFFEPGDSEKNSFQDFDNTFLELYNDIKEHGFLLEKGVIPLSQDGIVLDGAHRIAIAYLLGIDIPTIRLKIKSPNFGIDFFKRKGATQEEILNFIRINILYNKNLRVAIIWPYNNSRLEDIKKLYPAILHTENIDLNLNGVRNLCLLCYSEESWVGDYSNKWAGIKNKADFCYIQNKKTIFFIYETNSNQNDIYLKEKVRNLSDGSKNNIHTTDNIEETQYILNILLRKEASLLLNNLNLKVLSRIEKIIINKKIDKNKILITGSSVLSLLNIRNNNDIDILHDESIHIGDSSILGSHNKYNHLYVNDIKYLIADPFFHYNILGTKFIDLSNILFFKKNRNEQKDIIDIKLIKKHIDEDRKNIIYLKIKESINRKSRILYFRYRQYMVDFLKKTNLFNLAKKIIKKR
ncbi:ParB N-terminal domain-containing protein [Proteus terrae]|uniref:ParB/Sulfiredoxin domain-containing protein n=1 Tax=Proteus terrae subsp. cibarius TaxID=626774 RepID=A0A8I0WQY7_9GAMM|nr:hypothetical protein [Proteus terrae]MBG2914140.1 hypothetical protein [Proteus terrae subsp. cibarius]